MSTRIYTYIGSDLVSISIFVGLDRFYEVCLLLIIWLMQT